MSDQGIDLTELDNALKNVDQRLAATELPSIPGFDPEPAPLFQRMIKPLREEARPAANPPPTIPRPVQPETREETKRAAPVAATTAPALRTAPPEPREESARPQTVASPAPSRASQPEIRVPRKPVVDTPAVKKTEPVAAKKLPAVEPGKNEAGKKSPPDPRKWTLAPAESQKSWKQKSAVALAILALGIGGYCSYSILTEETLDGKTAGKSSRAGDEEETVPPQSEELPELDDPFNSPPPKKKLAMKSPAHPVRLAQRAREIPEIDEFEEPSLPRRALAPKPTRPIRTADDLDLPVDDPDEVEEFEAPPPSRLNAERGMPPRLLPANEPARPTVSKPLIRPALPANHSDDDDPLAGFEVSRKSRNAPARGEPSIIEAQDQAEQLQGYEPDEVDSHRAYSRTIVTSRSNGEGSSYKLVPAAGADPDLHEDEAAFGIRRRSNTAPPPINRSTPPAPFMAPQSVRTPTGSTNPASPTYTVAPNDNFWTISKRQYGTARYYAALTRHNQDRVRDPQRLRPGMQISTPPAAVLEASYPELIERAPGGAAPARSAVSTVPAGRPDFGPPGSPQPAERPSRDAGGSSASGYFYHPSGQPMYRIGPDDTLGGIAQKHLGRFSRWEEIYSQNQDILQSPDNLTVGTIIKLPSDASRVSLVPEGAPRR